MPTKTTTQLERVTTAYLACALWLAKDENGEPIGDETAVCELPDAVREQATTDCRDFLESNAEDLADMDGEQIGHDFWLTRNGHGAGFWDRGLGEVGERLTANCRPYGEMDLSVGDDGTWYLT